MLLHLYRNRTSIYLCKRESPSSDRRDAGAQLAAALAQKNLMNEPVVVFGIPRGGVIVADEIATFLTAPLDVLVARKIRAPHQPELAIGAVTSDEEVFFINDELAKVMGATPDNLANEMAYQRNFIRESIRKFRGGRPPLVLEGKTVIVVDDGMVTGFTFRAALQILLSLNKPVRVIAAVPVATARSLEMIQPFVEDIVCLSVSEYFPTIAAWYNRLETVRDEDILALLLRNRGERRKSSLQGSRMPLY